MARGRKQTHTQAHEKKRKKERTHRASLVEHAEEEAGGEALHRRPQRAALCLHEAHRHHDAVPAIGAERAAAGGACCSACPGARSRADRRRAVDNSPEEPLLAQRALPDGLWHDAR